MQCVNVVFSASIGRLPSWQIQFNRMNCAFRNHVLKFFNTFFCNLCARQIRFFTEFSGSLRFAEVFRPLSKVTNHHASHRPSRRPIALAHSFKGNQALTHFMEFVRNCPCFPASTRCELQSNERSNCRCNNEHRRKAKVMRSAILPWKKCFFSH